MAIRTGQTGLCTTRWLTCLFLTFDNYAADPAWSPDAHSAPRPAGPEPWARFTGDRERLIVLGVAGLLLLAAVVACGLVVLGGGDGGRPAPAGTAIAAATFTGVPGTAANTTVPEDPAATAIGTTHTIRTTTRGFGVWGLPRLYLNGRCPEKR
jgi:hypothetical protein